MLPSIFPLVVELGDVDCFYCGEKPDFSTAEETGKPAGAYRVSCKCGWNTYFDLKLCPTCQRPTLVHMKFRGNDGIGCHGCGQFYTNDLELLGKIF